MADRSDYLVIIPAYNEEAFIGSVVKAVLAESFPVLVIDDGSSDRTDVVAEAAGAQVLTQETNRGKGAALQAGFQYAAAREYRACITMDGDGQHAVEDLAPFVHEFEAGGSPVILGNRMAHPQGMPAIRRWTNRNMSRMLSHHIPQCIPDSQCGYRLYARATFDTLIATRPQGYAAESEVLLRLADAGFAMASVPVRSVYGVETSGINPVKDTWRFFRMLRKYRQGRNR